MAAGDTGGLVNVAGIGILAGSDNQEAALQLVDFLLSPQAQQYFADETNEYPLVAGVAATDGGAAHPRHAEPARDRPVGPRLHRRHPGAARARRGCSPGDHQATRAGGRSTPHPRHRWSSGLPVSPLVVVCRGARRRAHRAPLWYLAVQAFSEGLAEVVDELWRRRTLDLAVRVGRAGRGGHRSRSGRRHRRRRSWSPAPTSPAGGCGGSCWPCRWRSPPTSPRSPGSRGGRPRRVLGRRPGADVCARTRSSTCPSPRRCAASTPPTRRWPARSGARPAQVAFGLTLRQVRPAATAGALLVALYVLADFGAVATMRSESFTRVIYGAYRAGFDPHRAAVLAAGAGRPVARAGATARRRPAGAAHGTPGSAAAPAAGRHRAPRAGRAGRPGASSRASSASVLVAPMCRWSLRWVVRGRVDRRRRRRARLGARPTPLASAAGQPSSPSCWPCRSALLAARVRAALAQGIERTDLRGPRPARHRRSASRWSTSASAWCSPMYQKVPLLILAYVVLFLPLAVGRCGRRSSRRRPGLEEVARSLGPAPAVCARVNAAAGPARHRRRRRLVFLATHEGAPGHAAAAAHRHRDPRHRAVAAHLGQRLRLGGAVRARCWCSSPPCPPRSSPSTGAARRTPSR